MGTYLYDLAHAAWVNEWGFDDSLPRYIEVEGREVFYHLPFTVNDLHKSLNSHQLPYLELLELEVVKTQVTNEGRHTVQFVVTDLQPLAAPDEERTTDSELYFWPEPDWKGEGAIVEYGPTGYQVVNRLRFCFQAERDEPNLLMGAYIQYIDHQPQFG